MNINVDLRAILLKFFEHGPAVDNTMLQEGRKLIKEKIPDSYLDITEEGIYSIVENNGGLLALVENVIIDKRIPHPLSIRDDSSAIVNLFEYNNCSILEERKKEAKIQIGQIDFSIIRPQMDYLCYVFDGRGYTLGNERIIHLSLKRLQELHHHYEEIGPSVNVEGLENRDILRVIESMIKIRGKSPELS